MGVFDTVHSLIHPFLLQFAGLLPFLDGEVGTDSLESIEKLVILLFNLPQLVDPTSHHIL